jgi:hypothetical protein
MFFNDAGAITDERSNVSNQLDISPNSCVNASCYCYGRNGEGYESYNPNAVFCTPIRPRSSKID